MNEKETSKRILANKIYEDSDYDEDEDFQREFIDKNINQIAHNPSSRDDIGSI